MDHTAAAFPDSNRGAARVRSEFGESFPSLVSDMWILVIEDETRLADSLKEGFEREGYTVDVTGDGEKGEALALTNDYDLLIVDWRLPGRDGRSIVERIRAEGASVPVLMLTVLADVDHRIQGLEAGADDYVSKPFSFEELLARVRALLRRPPLDERQDRLEVGALEIDTRRREVRFGGEPVDLRPKEYGLLELCARNLEEVQSRTVIAERVWGDPFYVSDNTIDVTVSNLRSKLEEARSAVGGSKNGSVNLETVRGTGYRLTMESSSSG